MLLIVVIDIYNIFALFNCSSFLTKEIGMDALPVSSPVTAATIYTTPPPPNLCPGS